MLCGSVLAMFLGLLYLMFLRLPGVLSVVIWGLCLSILVLLLGIGAYGLNMASGWECPGDYTGTCPEGYDEAVKEHEDWTAMNNAHVDNPNNQAPGEEPPLMKSRTHEDYEIKGLRYMSYFVLAMAAIYLLYLICMRARIQLAIEVVKEAGRAVNSMPIIVFWPCFQALGLILFLVVWCYYILYALSAGEMKVERKCVKNRPGTSVYEPGYCRPDCVPYNTDCDGISEFCVGGVSTETNCIRPGNPPCDFIAFSGDEAPMSDFMGTGDEGCGCSPDACLVYLTYRYFEYDQNQKYAFLYMLFSYFWTSEFIVAMGQLIVALAVSMWYFNKDKATNIGNQTVFKAVRWGFLYHMGSAAFGSLIIAIIKTIRAIVKYMQYQAMKMAKGNKVAQKLAMMIFCIIDCYLWCIEKCMKFINKNAYIQIAIFGCSFCTAAKKAFFLILRNIARIAAVAMVSSFVLLIGKLAVPIAATFICYVWLGTDEMQAQLNGVAGPLVLTFLISYYVMAMFNEVFGMAIWTVLQCFVADEEMKGGYGEGGLKKLTMKPAPKEGMCGGSKKEDDKAPEPVAPAATPEEGAP